MFRHLIPRARPSCTTFTKPSLPISSAQAFIAATRNRVPIIPPKAFFSSHPARASPSMSPSSSSFPFESFKSLLESRRSFYVLSAESPIPDNEIVDLVNTTLKQTPSSFNTQTTRVVTLLNEDHQKLWDLTVEAFKGLVADGAIPAEAFEQQAKPRLDLFRAAKGTVLFYVSKSAVEAAQQQFARYGEHVPSWATESSGMTQYAAWLALKSVGLGANLQHYGGLVDKMVQETWGISPDWEPKAQLVFGTPAGPAKEKTFMPLEERTKVFGAK